MSRAWLQAGSVGVVLYANLTDPNNSNAAINLTGATLRLYITKPDGTPLSTRTPTLNGAATLGQIQYTTQSDEFTGTVGGEQANWFCQVEAYYSAAQIYRSEVFAIPVRPSLR